ncbi:ArnT family glycosyltransferase [Mucilaginibacter pocheonensis]|uniref:4-amino-4-deoxy-L-arabinose transferase-like glycosyltransferase n=1 Tax=Mucilaginibacter pocheonensis TaxID=398050 RepID=A0ABU1T4H7_9SPHI|nr:glycosyltransferase family 39 protein [Mucilaginibacter pocheonensis]MDR6940292.1 4-amino-4-deoxy-L-arabinose transferase-like glycosyltransferase [Mucilaginibacter pocheonensis]
MDQPDTANQTKWLYLFIGMAVALNFSGLFITVMGPDGNLYATIAKTMVQRNNYADLFAWGADWLDKPHFPFWVTALFFKCFGFTTWAYKLPGILFVMMGAIYTYHLAKALYNKQIALWAVLILLTAQHIVLSNNDVRAEPYLTGLIIAAVYHFYKTHTRNSFWQLVLACLFTACAIMTKGMFALITIGGAIIGHLVITRQWKQLFHWRWLLAIVLILLFILPEIWCLYRQFDLHPEKTVFGRTGVSGVKFFFWDSQFGRFFNTGPIKGSGDPSFFIHTTLWAFLPWSLLLFAAIFQFIKKGVRNVQAQEWYCICGSMLTFLLFSASKFQLPHYIVIVFPFFAIITAQYLYHLTSVKSIRAVRITQVVVIVLMLTIIGTLQYFYRAETFTWLTGSVILIFLLALIFVPARISAGIQQTIYCTLLASFIVNLYLNLCFYPSLLRYQAGSEAAMWINKNNPQKLPVYVDDGMFHDDMNFYLHGPVTEITPETKGTVRGRALLYANTGVIHDFEAKGWKFQVIKTFKRYPVTRLTPRFLNKATRDKELSEMQLVLLHP